MGTNGRTGRRRKRKKSSGYKREYGSAVHEIDYLTLLKWGKRNGICFGKLRPAIFHQTGRGLMTCRKLRSCDLVISVPEKMLITSKTAEQSEIGQQLVELQLTPLLSSKQMLCVFILYEKFLGKRSFWNPYISTLPRTFNTPAYFNEEEIQALPCNLQQQCIAQITTVQESFKGLNELLQKYNTMLDKKFLNYLTFDEFRWAWFVVNTRSVYKPNSLDMFPGCAVHMQTENAYALAPGLDLLNHSDTAEVKAGFNHGNNSYEIHTLTVYNKGLQVFINYGPHDNRKLLMEYGFILPKNIHNTVKFSWDLLYAVVMTDISGISKRKRETISINQLDKDLCCSEENGLSWSTLVLLRILAIDENSFKREWQRVLTGERLSEDVERRVLQWKQCLIQKVLETYEEADRNDVIHVKSNGHLSENMQLALQLRNQEKQILGSTLEIVASGCPRYLE